MNLIFAFLTTILLGNINQENSYIGTWEYYDIRSFKKTYQVTQKEYDNLKSQIVFAADMTFVKTTNGKITEGRYSFTSNTFKFLEKDENGEYFSAWSIRVPKKWKIDLNYPELFNVTDENGNPSFAELDVYYKKIN